MLLRHRLKTLSRNISSSSSTRTKVPVLCKTPEINDPNENKNDTVTLQVFSWGRGASGQLGGLTEESRLYPAPVTSLIVSQPFSVAEVSGRIFDDCSGKSDGKRETSIGISCGLFHSGLAVDGKLWIWGKGDGGRLGFGHENSASVPTLNPYLDDHVRCISLGGVHSVALGSLGQLFTWGYGGFCALGRSVYHRELFPQLVEGAWNGKIKHVAISGMRTAAITESGLELKGENSFMGYGGHGQLGHSSTQNTKLPMVIEALADECVVHIGCEGSSSAAVTDKGKLYMWGNAKDSQLGVPRLPELQPCSVKVKFLMEDDGLGPHKVLSVAVGASHTMCLVSRS